MRFGLLPSRALSRPENNFASELRQLIWLATPIAAAHLGMVLLGAVDTAVVGRLGERELAAVGIGNALFFAFLLFGVGLVQGLDPLIAQALGAGKPGRARGDMWQGLWLVALVTMPLLVATSLAADAVGHLGIEPLTARQASAYVHARLPGLPGYMLLTVLRSYLQARYRTRPIVVAAVVANLLNLPLNWLLVFGDAGLIRLGLPAVGMPALGVSGAGLTSAAVTLLQTGVVAWAVRLDPIRASFRYLPQPSRIRVAARIGFPTGLQRLAEVGVFSLAGILMAKISTLDAAAHQVAMTLASATFMVPLGISAAAAVRVGSAVGRRDQAGIRRAGLAAFFVAGVFMAGCALALLLLPELLSSVLTNKASVVAAARPLLMVAAVFQVSDGLQVVGGGALRGAGDTRVPLLFNLIGHYGIGVPLGVALAFYAQWGGVGLWWGLFGGLSAVAFALILRFWRLTASPIEPVAS